MESFFGGKVLQQKFQVTEHKFRKLHSRFFLKGINCILPPNASSRGVKSSIRPEETFADEKYKIRLNAQIFDIRIDEQNFKYYNISFIHICFGVLLLQWRIRAEL